jgi:CubicO group peptidase (beta-lactamase class C family)
MRHTLHFPVILLAFSALLEAAEPAPVFPGAAWETATPAEVNLDEAKLSQARAYALTGDGSGVIVRHGKLVMSWGDQTTLYDLKSTAKSIGVTVLGLALKDRKVKLDDLASKYHPTFGVPPGENSKTGWLDTITLRMLANQTAGFDKKGGYQPLLFEPGAKWHYSDGGPNWLAECLTYVYKRDLNDVMFERVFTPLGITPKDIRWRKHAYRPEFMEVEGAGSIKRREFGSGFSANVQAMARFGTVYLHSGKWRDQQILPEEFVKQASTVGPELKNLVVNDPDHHAGAATHYGLLWWNNNDGALENVPRDTYWTWGLFDGLIFVFPSLDMVVARAGKSWKRTEGAPHYAVLEPFLEPIATAAKDAPAASAKAPYPASKLIKEVQWAPVSSIVRKAKGGDNWPLTWADDGHLYTAYGDARGFEPFVTKKLSMGLARVEGGPEEFTGINIASKTADAVGDGPRGRKASGMLMVDSLLCMLARNTRNSQLGWSTDHGATWTWADWKFTESFGCPAFVNFGQNYAGARDEFVYIVSTDANTAYERSDRLVLARVPQQKLRERDAYEFFVKLDASGQAAWSKDIKERGATFANPASCYRSHLTYNPALKRYLLTTIGQGKDTRFAGGFGIYDAPEPWGPWTTVYYTNNWDTGPGESCSFPSKWFSPDGKTAWLVFSGDDCFSVRKATFLLR